MKDENHWAVDKKIPIALIVTMALQTGAGVWWASSTTERLNTLEKRTEAAAPIAERVARVETKLEAVNDNLKEIKDLLRRPEERR